MELADQIRNNLTQINYGCRSERALLAVVERCEQDFSSGMTTTARRAAYTSVLTVIARELGINEVS